MIPTTTDRWGRQTTRRGPHGLTIAVLDGFSLDQAEIAIRRWHYLQSAPDPRTRSICYAVHLARHSFVGYLFFGRPQATSCYSGELTFGTQAQRDSGKVRFDRWELLNLSRVWFKPDFQKGGGFCSPDHLPGFHDRRGHWHSTLASSAIRLALHHVGHDYLMRRPPVFLDQPYQIRAVLSYCDSKRHRGILYGGAGFRLSRINRQGMQTWFTEDVDPLTEFQDRMVKGASVNDPRARKIRARQAQPTAGLFEEV